VPTIPNPQNQPNPTPDGWPTDGAKGKPVPTPQRIREQLRLFLILLLGLIIINQLALPFRLGGLVLSLAIGWVGIRLLIGMSALSRTGAPVQGWPSVIIGLGLAGVLTMLLIVQAAYYPLNADRERCLAEANTLKAVDDCDQDFQDRFRELTDELIGRPTTG
jgi:hypothetical protein